MSKLDGLDVIGDQISRPFLEFVSSYYGNYIDWNLTELKYIELCLVRLHERYDELKEPFKDVDLFNLLEWSGATTALREEIDKIDRKHRKILNLPDIGRELTDVEIHYDLLFNKMKMLFDVQEVIRKIKFIRSNLLKLGYNEYIVKKDGVVEFIEKNSMNNVADEPDTEDKKTIAYRVALLNETGFFDLPKIKNKSIKEQNKIAQLLLNGSESTIKNNRNSLNDDSNVSIKYTAYKHKNEVKRLLE